MRENNGLIEFKGKLYLFGGRMSSSHTPRVDRVRLQWSTVVEWFIQLWSWYQRMAQRWPIRCRRPLPDIGRYVMHRSATRFPVWLCICCSQQLFYCFRRHLLLCRFDDRMLVKSVARLRWLHMVEWHASIQFWNLELGRSTCHRQVHVVGHLWSLSSISGQIPSIRSCPSWCKEGDSVYVFGGYDGIFEWTCQHEILNPRSSKNEWPFWM